MAEIEDSYTNWQKALDDFIDGVAVDPMAKADLLDKAETRLRNAVANNWTILKTLGPYGRRPALNHEYLVYRAIEATWSRYTAQERAAIRAWWATARRSELDPPRLRWPIRRSSFANPAIWDALSDEDGRLVGKGLALPRPREINPDGTLKTELADAFIAALEAVDPGV